MFCHDIAQGEFATLFCACISPDRSNLVYCNCGHDIPVLLRRGKCLDLAQSDIVLGIDKDAEYHAHELDLLPNDVLVMYTDGLADAVNFKRESFSRKRIIDAALESVDLTSEQAAKNILWLMRKFTGLTQSFDDTALVVLKRTE
jgi:sigma-B regulation protein RsbU (phosphoserine phosphatase)